MHVLHKLKCSILESIGHAVINLKENLLNAEPDVESIVDVSLMPENRGSAQLKLCLRMGSSTGIPNRKTDLPTEFSIFENQRRAVLYPHEFGPSNLLLNERAPFSDDSGYNPAPYSCLDDVTPPTGFVWDPSPETGGWKIDYTYTQTDPEGWCYGIDFNFISSNLKKGESTTSPFLRSVRRRRWTRAVLAELIRNNRTVSSSSL